MARTAYTAICMAALLVCAPVWAEEAEEADEVEVFSVPDVPGYGFLETFQDDPFQGRWVESSDKTYDGQSWGWEAPKGVEGVYADDMVSWFAASHPVFLACRSSVLCAHISTFFLFVNVHPVLVRTSGVLTPRSSRGVLFALPEGP